MSEDVPGRSRALVAGHGDFAAGLVVGGRADHRAAATRSCRCPTADLSAGDVERALRERVDATGARR